MTAEEMAATIEAARRAGWGEGMTVAELLDGIVAVFRAVQSGRVPAAAAPGANPAALAVVLAWPAAVAQLWLKQQQPCHLCGAPARRACDPDCLSGQMDGIGQLVLTGPLDGAAR